MPPGYDPDDDLGPEGDSIDDPWTEDPRAEDGSNGDVWEELEAERLAADRERRRVLLTLLCLALVAAGWTLSTNPYVPPGHEGYIFERPRIFGKGGFRGVVEGPGNFGLSLSRHEVLALDMRPLTHTETFDILSADDLRITFRFHTVTQLEAGSVRRMVELYGADRWYPRFVKEPLRTFVRDAAQRYGGTEVKVMRDSMTEEVRARLADYLSDTPIRLLGLVVGHIDYPETVTRAVESKLAAQQLLEEKATQMEIARQNAAIRIEEARGEAEAQRIINSTLTPEYLQYEAIRSQRTMAEAPGHSTVYIPIGPTGIPLVQPLRSSPSRPSPSSPSPSSPDGR